MTLTENETIRQVLLRLTLDPGTKINWLQRRAIKRGREYTKRDFRRRRRGVMQVINMCVKKMNAILANGGLEKAEEEYAKNRRFFASAPVDILIGTVRMEMNTLDQLFCGPPELKRSCTGFFGCTVSADGVDFAEWETP